MQNYLNNLNFYEKRNLLLELLLKNVGIGDKERSFTHLEGILNSFEDFSITIRFEEMLLFSSELNVLLRHLSHTYKVHAHYCEETYQRFRKELSGCSLPSQLEKIMSDMIDCYLQLIREHSRRQYSNLIRACLDYIDFHYAQPITLATEAVRLSVSASYLSSRFMQETGENFVSYVNTVRIRYACTLLEKLQIPIQKVAELCGFSSSNYFARVFHQQMGISPTEYRKRVQKASA